MTVPQKWSSYLAGPLLWQKTNLTPSNILMKSLCLKHSTCIFKLPKLKLAMHNTCSKHSVAVKINVHDS